MGQSEILNLLRKHPLAYMSRTEIMDELHINMNSVARTVKQLVAFGFIEKVYEWDFQDHFWSDVNVQ